MKKHLLHIALAVTAASLTTLDASAQLSPLLTPRLKLKDPGSVNSINIAPPALTAPYTLTLPPDDGTASQVLTTDGNGVLTWTTQSSGSGTLNTVAKFTSATTIGNSSIIDDGTLVSINTTGTGKSVLIGSAGAGSSVELVAGSSGISIGTGVSAGTVTIGRSGGTITTLGSIGHTGTFTSSGLITGSAGATISGAATSINASSNFATNINTGTSTGAVAIGNSLSTTAIAGATSITGAATINTTGNANTTIGSATTTGTTTIATNSSTGRFVVSGLPVLTSGTDDVLIINASNQISRIAPINLVGSSWQLTGNATTDAWNGTTGMRLGTTSTQPLVLATTNATAQDIIFYTGANGASERMRIAGTTGLVTMQNALTVSGLITGSAGATISGAITNVNVNSNFATNINTGTSTGAVNIGTGASSGTVTIGRTSGTITTIGAIGHTGTITSSGLITGTAGATISGAATSINASSNFATSINTGTSTGAVTIGNTANTTTVGSIATTLKTTIGTNDRIVVASSTGQLDQASPAAIVRAGTRAGRVTGLSNVIVTPTAISVPNLDNNDVIIVTLEAAAAAVVPVFTIVRTTGVGGTFLVHFSAPYTGTLNWLVIDL